MRLRSATGTIRSKRPNGLNDNLHFNGQNHKKTDDERTFLLGIRKTEVRLAAAMTVTLCFSSI